MPEDTTNRGYYKEFLEDIVEMAIKNKASDIHFSVGKHPILRVEGVLTPVKEKKILTPEDTEGVATIILGDRKEEMKNKKSLDFSYSYKDKARFRVNSFFQKGFYGVAMRLIPSKVRTIEELNLPSTLHQFSKMEQGFVLATGPASQGKSTTLAAIIDEINRRRKEHIITIEDPVEYLFKQQDSIIDQREVGHDTLSFHKALRATLRQDPDVVFVGEMRDKTSISIALTAAETGHLVFSTLHTNSAAQTVDRIIDTFPPEQQRQIRIQLAASLSGIISQRLLQRVGGGRIPACEILIGNSAVSNIIREGKTPQLNTVISTSSKEGMIPLNRSLVNLVKQKEITQEQAVRYSLDVKELRLMMK